MISYGTLIDPNDKTERKLKYNFSDLEGIIFGINTSQEDKVEIRRIIEAKCREHKRPDFSFYQARYSIVSGKIEAKKMGLKLSL